MEVQTYSGYSAEFHRLYYDLLYVMLGTNIYFVSNTTFLIICSDIDGSTLI